jgi:ADP-ribose pyrophosphatase YjhB (NUDIX family)
MVLEAPSSRARERGCCMDCRVHRLVADVALLAEGSVALVRHLDTRRYDGQTGWFLPDDYLAHLEHPVDAAARVVQEQVGVSVQGVELGQIESFGDGAWHLAFHYVARLDRRPELRPGRNVRDAAWFPFDALPPHEVVAHHGWALDILKEVAGT